MTDGFKQFETGGSEEFSDERLRAYLLGELREDERLRLDQRVLTDDDVSERVRLAEAQLIDEYVAGELDAHAAGVFHTHFLKTDARREQVRMTAALQNLASPSTVVVPVPRAAQKRTWRDALAPFLTIKVRSPWATAGVFALVILGISVIAYLGPQLPPPERQVAQQPSINAASTPAIASSPAQVAQVPPTASPTTPQLKPTPSEPPVAVASFVLLPGALRGSGEMTRVAVPRGERAILRLSLVLENPSPGEYQAELANADGKTVTVRKNLRPHRNGQTKITLDLPARLVQPDDYQVKLTRQTDGQLESVGRYYFRALPE